MKGHAYVCNVKIVMKKIIVNSGILSFGAVLGTSVVSADVLKVEDAKVLPKEIAEVTHDADYYYFTFNKSGNVDIRNDELVKVDYGKDGIAQFTDEYVRIPKALVTEKLYVEFDGVVYYASKAGLDDSKMQPEDTRRKFEKFYNAFVEEHKAEIQSYSANKNYAGLDALQQKFKKEAQEKFGNGINSFKSATPVVGGKFHVTKMTKDMGVKPADEAKPVETKKMSILEPKKDGEKLTPKMTSNKAEPKKAGEMLDTNKTMTSSNKLDTKKAGDTIKMPEAGIRKVVTQPKNPFNNKEMQELNSTIGKIAHDDRYYYIDYVAEGLTQIKSDNYQGKDSPAEFSDTLARIKKTDVKDYVYIKHAGKYYYIGRDKLDGSVVRAKDLRTEIEEFEEEYKAKHGKEIEALRNSGNMDKILEFTGKYEALLQEKFGDRVKNDKLTTYFRPAEGIMVGVGGKYKGQNYTTNVDDENGLDKVNALKKDGKNLLTSNKSISDKVAAKLGNKQLPQTGSTDVFGTIGSSLVVLGSFIGLMSMLRKKENE